MFVPKPITNEKSEVEDKWSNRGILVWDPFFGTGTTAVACSRFGCSFIGSEIDKKVRIKNYYYYF